MSLLVGQEEDARSVCRPVCHGLSPKGRSLIDTVVLYLVPLLELFGLSEENLTFEVRRLNSRLLRSGEVNIFYRKWSGGMLPFMRLCLSGLSPVKPQEAFVPGFLLTKSLCTIKASHKVGNTFVWLLVIYFYYF